MKSNIKILLISLALITTSVIFPQEASAQYANVSFQVFYDQLSPYGQWVDYPSYGYVWIPNAGPDFVPYSTAGHWVWTEFGWTWVSDYDWGWAPFHYGRWDYDDFYGWIWIPDDVWGPAWVSWRFADGFFGWCPLGFGISVNASFGRHFDRDHDHWMFVKDRDLGRDHINKFLVNGKNSDRILSSSTVINNSLVDNKRNATYVTGPSREDVQKVTGRKINPVTIQENSRPGQVLKNGQLQIYRPQVINNNDRRAIPTRTSNLKDVKRPSERNATNTRNTVTPINNNERIQQPRNETPPSNNERIQQPRNEAPPTNNERMEQPRNVNPPMNNERMQEPNMTRPENNNRNSEPRREENNRRY